MLFTKNILGHGITSEFNIAYWNVLLRILQLTFIHLAFNNHNDKNCPLSVNL